MRTFVQYPDKYGLKSLNLNSIKCLTNDFFWFILNLLSMNINSVFFKRENQMSTSGKEKVVIIGGGIAGLTAGIYALYAGFDAEIYEKNTIPGGECKERNRTI